MKKSYYIFFFVIQLFNQIRAQPPRAAFRHFSTANGLSDNTVTCICQDCFGFMWMGTENGLNRYDGYVFKIYQNDPHDSTSISDNNINTIYEDANGNLWIGTSKGGLNLFLRSKNTFKPYRANDDSSSLADDFVKCIYGDREGNLWIGTDSGIGLYNKETDSFDNYLTDSYVKTIFEDDQGLLWIGTGFNGLFQFDKKQNRFKQYVHDSSDPRSISSNYVEAIAGDMQRRLWIGTIDGGLNLYVRETDSFVAYQNNQTDINTIPNNTIYELLLDQYGNLWAGFENGGLSRLVVHSKRHLSIPQLSFENHQHVSSQTHSLSNNTVRSIYADNQGNLWVGTYGGGLNVLRRNRKQFVNHHNEPFNEHSLSHNIVQTFLEDHQGNVWIGTDGGGLNHFNPTKNTFVKIIHDPNDSHSLCSNHVLDICEDFKGNLWVATWDGLNYFNMANDTFLKYEQQEGNPFGLTSNKTTCVLEDSQRNIWVGTLSGLNLFDRNRRLFTHSYPGLGQDLDTKYIQCLYEDHWGNIWIGTVWGLYKIKYESIHHKKLEFDLYLHSEQDTTTLSDNHILSIVEDSHGFIWLATLTGLNRFDPKNNVFKSYTRQNGLASNWIMSIIEDNCGNIWLGTHKGITKFDPVSETVTNYDIHDGLVSSEYTKGVLKYNTGELYFGGKTGFTRFYPDSIKQSSYIPPVVLTDFQIYNRSVPLDYVRQKDLHESDTADFSIELSHKQNVFSFEFAALDYTAPEKNLYQYKLEGFDSEWRMTNADRRFATYTNLPGGDYLFHVRGSNSDGIWNEEGLFISLKIHPPFWKTKWALLIYIGIILTVLILMRELIVYREKLKSEILLERKEAERIHELDEIKLRFFTNISHEFRTPLTLIIGLLERLMRLKGPLKRKILFHNYHIMLRNAKRLLRLIHQIMDIRKLDQGRIQLELKQRDMIYFIKSIYSSFAFQAEQRHIQYQLKTNIEKLLVWFDPDKIDTIVYNILSNAFKFTKDGGRIQVRIHVSAKPDNINHPIGTEEKTGSGDIPSQTYLNICIEDNGIGIPHEYLEKIYEPFFQIESRDSVLSKGTGIGLALTRELINLHQGHIDVKSENGKGSCFMVQIPLFLEPEKIEKEQNDTISDNENDSIPEDQTPSTESMSFLDKHKSTSLILVVDDDIDFCHYLRDELYDDYRMIEALNGEDAYKMAVEFVPDLIVSDVKMPGMDGFQLCSKVKQNPNTSHIPVILLTSQTTEKDRINGFDFGADDYIEKPFDVYLLRTRIANLLESRKKLKEKFSHEIYLQPKNITVTPEDERFLNHVVQIIDEHMEDSEFQVTRLGNEIGLSRVQLYRKIKTLTDFTPNDLIKSIRLKRAAKLLEESKQTVFEVAYRVGFKDPSYFCKCFRSQYGSSPAKYARTFHIQQNEDAVSPSVDS